MLYRDEAAARLPAVRFVLSVSLRYSLGARDGPCHSLVLASSIFGLS